MSSMHMRVLMIIVRGEEGWRTGKFKTWKEKKQAIFRSKKPKIMKNSLLRLAEIANHKPITSLALTKSTQWDSLVIYFWNEN